MTRKIRDYVITALIALLVTVIALNVPARYFDIRSFFPSFGTALTDVQSSDNLSSFPSLYNANLDLTPNLTEANTFTALNQFSNASTSLLTVGNIIATTSATSTFTGGISALRYYSTATSTFTNGLVVTGGCILFNSTCLAVTTVTSVANSDSTLTISPTSGDVVASLNLAKANIWTATTTFNSGLDADCDADSPCIFNGVSYRFSSAAAPASSTVLMSDGASPVQSLSFNYPDWRLIVSTTTQQAMNIATTTFSATDEDLRVVIYSPATASGLTDRYIQFNGDFGSNYGYGAKAYGGLLSSYQANAAPGIKLHDDAVSTTSPFMFEMIIKNTAANVKPVFFKNTYFPSGTGAPGYVEGAANWNNTSSLISSIQYRITGANTIPAGMTIRVYGSGR